MNEPKSALVSIGELQDYRFFVDSYQRGYKWETSEVEALLNDIHAFKKEDDNFYCLQPIVVKAKEDSWELIDGQQRLTTIFMILKVLSDEDSVFEMDYQTRKQSAEFLKEINIHSAYESWVKFAETNKNLENIDNYHFFKAFKKIQDFFNDEDLKSEFRKKLLDDVKLIWYKVKSKDEDVKSKDEDSRTIFTRINAGKIPLETAELLKAWFLNQVLEPERTNRANQWNDMEQKLRQSYLWYTLTDKIV